MSGPWSLFELFLGSSDIRVLDIGAAIVETPPYQSWIDLGRASVIGFEPNERECARLNAVYGPKHRFLPYFLGDGTKSIFHETNWSMTGSLFSPNTSLLSKFGNLAEVTTEIAQHEVETRRIDDIPDIDDVDFIKIDVQGAELTVLQNATKALENALVIQTEVEFLELYRGQPLFADVDRFLRQQGYLFHTFDGFGMRSFKPLVRDGDANLGFRQYLWSDAVYVRSWMDLSVLSYEKLVHFAIIAHDLLHSFDLTHLILSELETRVEERFTSKYLEKISRQGSGTLSNRSQPNGGAMSQETRRDVNDPENGENDESLRLETIHRTIQCVPADLECLSTYVLLEQETWFERELDFVVRLAWPGMNAIDVGANLGVYSIPLAKMIGASGRVWAYEPGNRVRSYLQRSRSINECENLEISHLALSSESGNGWLRESWSDELRSIVSGTETGNDGQYIETSTLDAEAVLHAWTGIDFVKIDAEGMEDRIIAGGRRFFRDHSPLVMYEINNGGVHNLSLRWLFEVLGYQAFRLNGDGSFLSPVGDEQPDRYMINMFAVKPCRAEELAARGLLVNSAHPFDVGRVNRDFVLAKFLELPYAQELEITSADFEVGTEYDQALVAYGAYRFCDMPTEDRWSALEFSFKILKALCSQAPTSARLSSLARVAISSHRIAVALEALESIRSLYGISNCREGHSVEIDEPFFPPCKRYENLSMRSDPSNWFACSVLEGIEGLGAYSSRFGGLNPDALKTLCESPYGAAELVRRWVLKCVRRGHIPQKIAFYEKLSERNEQFWGDGQDWIPGIREMARNSKLTGKRVT